jgi:hypothetical protein
MPLQERAAIGKDTRGKGFCREAKNEYRERGFIVGCGKKQQNAQVDVAQGISRRRRRGPFQKPHERQEVKRDKRVYMWFPLCHRTNERRRESTGRKKGRKEGRKEASKRGLIDITEEGHHITSQRVFLSTQ